MRLNLLDNLNDRDAHSHLEKFDEVYPHPNAPSRPVNHGPLKTQSTNTLVITEAEWLMMTMFEDMLGFAHLSI